MSPRVELKKLFLESKEMVKYFDLTANIEEQYNNYVAKLNEIKALIAANPEFNNQNPWEDEILKSKKDLRVLLSDEGFSILEIEDSLQTS